MRTYRNLPELTSLWMVRAETLNFSAASLIDISFMISSHAYTLYTYYRYHADHTDTT